MSQINKESPVLVTGATGYVAGWIVKRLLDEGLTVHAAVRNPSDKEKTKYLQALADKSAGDIKFFKSDLLETGSYAEAMQDCEVVFHTASPFTLSVHDPVKDLVEPAQKGTRNVLEQANLTESVKKIVVTSSVAAIYSDNADTAKTKNNIFTEEYWNTSSSTEHNAYSYSKTLAEKEAWKICEKQNRWELVCINPSLVIGPGINPNGTSESFNLVKQLGNGTYKNGAPVWEISLVDVRDLAEAHFQGAFNENAKGRYIISACDSSFLDMASILSAKYDNKFPFPKKALPKFLVWLVAPIMDKNLTRKSISLNVGHKLRLDNSKSIKELGLNYRPVEDSLVEFFQQLIDNKTV